jgi:hypothetical protein
MIKLTGHEDNGDNVTILYLTLQLKLPRAHKMSSFHVCDDFKISKISLNAALKQSM